MHYFSSDLPHGPYPKSNDYNNKPLDYDPSSKTISSKIGNHKAGYYQNIEEDNDQLGRVLNMLETVSDIDESVFIYISDHGLKGKWSVRETGLKIPMVFRWPNVIPPNTTNDKLVSIVDILPTIIEISGGKKIENLDGKSLCLFCQTQILLFANIFWNCNASKHTKMLCFSLEVCS